MANTFACLPSPTAPHPRALSDVQEATPRNAEKCTGWSTENCGALNASGRKHAPGLERRLEGDYIIHQVIHSQLRTFSSSDSSYHHHLRHSSPGIFSKMNSRLYQEHGAQYYSLQEIGKTFSPRYMQT